MGSSPVSSSVSAAPGGFGTMRAGLSPATRTRCVPGLYRPRVVLSVLSVWACDVDVVGLFTGRGRDVPAARPLPHGRVMARARPDGLEAAQRQTRDFA